MHSNFSFDDKNGYNALSTGGKGGPEHLNNLARGCLVGLLDHHNGLAGLIASTANSYDRLQLRSRSSHWQNWGGDHRNVTTRISSEGGAKERLKHRMADASSNPYTAFAAVLQAAVLGVENGCDLQPIETGDEFLETDATIGATTDLKSAVAGLAADNVLANAVSIGLVENHVFMTEDEVEKTVNLDPEALMDFYIYYM